MKEELKFGVKKLYYLMSLKVAVANNGGKGRKSNFNFFFSFVKSDCHYRIYIQMSRVVTEPSTK